MKLPFIFFCKTISVKCFKLTGEPGHGGGGRGVDPGDMEKESVLRCKERGPPTYRRTRCEEEVNR